MRPPRKVPLQLCTVMPCDDDGDGDGDDDDDALTKEAPATFPSYFHVTGTARFVDALN